MFRRLGLRLIILPDDWVAYIPCRACMWGPAWSSNCKNRTPARNLIERDVPFCALQQGLVLSKVQITAPQRARICPVGVYIAILCSPRFCIGAVHFQPSIHQSTLFRGCNSLFDVNSESQREIEKALKIHPKSQRQRISQDSSQRVQTT